MSAKVRVALFAIGAVLGYALDGKRGVFIGFGVVSTVTDVWDTVREAFA